MKVFKEIQQQIHTAQFAIAKSLLRHPWIFGATAMSVFTTINPTGKATAIPEITPLSELPELISINTTIVIRRRYTTKNITPHELNGFLVTLLITYLSLSRQSLPDKMACRRIFSNGHQNV